MTTTELNKRYQNIPQELKSLKSDYNTTYDANNYYSFDLSSES